MIIESLEVNNFRNLSGKIFWGPGLNIIHGNNGQGKTNWLEAIHVLSRTKSFRTQRLQESIRFGEDTAFMAGKVSTGTDVHRDLEVTLRPVLAGDVRPREPLHVVSRRDGHPRAVLGLAVELAERLGQRLGVSGRHQ